MPGNAQTNRHSWEDSARVNALPASQRIDQYLLATEFHFDSLSLSLQYGNKALQASIENNIKSKEALVKQKLASIYLEHDIYDKALIFAHEALNTYTNLKEENGELVTRGTIAWIYYDVGQTDMALASHQQLLLAYEKKQDNKNTTWVLNAIGLDYSQKKEFTKALPYFEKSLLLSRELNLPERISSSLNNIGMVLNSLGQYDKAIVSLRNAYNISLAVNEPLRQAENLNQIANTYLTMNLLDSAEFYLVKARSIIETSKANARKEKLIDNYEFSTKVYLKRNDYQKAFHFLKLYIELKEEVISLEKNNNLANALMLHQTQQKQQEIELLESENKFKVLQRDTLAGAILLLGIIGALVYNRQITNQKKERLIYETQQALIQKELDRSSLEKEALEKEILLSESQNQLAQKKLENANLEKESLQAKLDFKNTEFTNAAIHLSQRNELVRTFLDELKEINLRTPTDSSARINRIINHFSQVQMINKDAEAFHLNMESEYKDFLFKLTNRFPDLTENEKRLCAQMRLNLSIKDISSINNISVKSVEMARYRLRKKLNMNHGGSLGDFLNSL